MDIERVDKISFYQKLLDSFPTGSLLGNPNWHYMPDTDKRNLMLRFGEEIVTYKQIPIIGKKIEVSRSIIQYHNPVTSLWCDTTNQQDVESFLSYMGISRSIRVFPYKKEKDSSTSLCYYAFSIEGFHIRGSVELDELRKQFFTAIVPDLYNATADFCDKVRKNHLALNMFDAVLNDIHHKSNNSRFFNAHGGDYGFEVSDDSILYDSFHYDDRSNWVRSGGCDFASFGLKNLTYLAEYVGVGFALSKFLISHLYGTLHFNKELIFIRFLENDSRNHKRRVYFKIMKPNSDLIAAYYRNDSKDISLSDW